MKIVLASGSPRRRELLSLITENFAVCPADADESLRDGAPLADEVVRLSRLKAEAAMQSHQDAEMLRRLRGRTHEVLTGLAVLSPDGGAQTLCTRTEVTFRDFSEEELAEYLATGEPLDKDAFDQWISENVGKEENIPFQDLTEDAISQIQ